MTTKPDIDAIARDAAKNCAPGSNTELVVPIIAEALILSQGRLATIIAAAIRRAQGETYPNLFQELSRQLTEAREVLKDVEFASAACPICHGTIGHHPDCKLARVLNK